MDFMMGYITVGTMLALYGMATMVVSIELVSIGKDLVGLRK
jgi:hypothetical protein